MIDDEEELKDNGLIEIDGVNVAECKHHLSTDYCEIQLVLQNNNFKLPYGKHLECYLCKNCYYKRYKNNY